jgi:hypothetical protein
MADYTSLDKCSLCKDHVHSHVAHFFGCIKEKDKDAYLENLPAKAKDQIEAEKQQIEQSKKRLEAQIQGAAAYDGGGKLLQDFKQSLSHWRRRGKAPVKRPMPPQEPDPQELEDDPNFQPEDDPDLKASMIFFKDSGYGMRAYSLPGFEGEFPNQKIQLKTLIFEENPRRNPLAEKCEPEMIRYFHLPANNMTWVEVGNKFIAQSAVD